MSPFMQLTLAEPNTVINFTSDISVNVHINHFIVSYNSHRICRKLYDIQEVYNFIHNNPIIKSN